MTTLCIVDMQTMFESNATKCLSEVCYEIELAKRRKAGIVVLEFGRCGETLPEIKRLLAGYERVAFAEKYKQGGGAEFLAVAKAKGFRTDRIRVAGVLRSQCVAATVEDLKYRFRERGRRIQISIDATWCDRPGFGEQVLRRLGSFVKHKRGH